MSDDVNTIWSQARMNGLYPMLEDIQRRLNMHDIELAKLKTQSESMHQIIVDLQRDVRTLDHTTGRILSTLEGHQAKQSILFKTVVTLLPLVSALEIWGRL